MGYLDDNIDFRITQDGSAGLYDKKAGDILHSETGALKEAEEKFILPVLDAFEQLPDNIRILDICYGIGYNTKAAFKALKNKIVHIDALELNKELILISPFIKDGINDFDLKSFLLNAVLKLPFSKEDEEVLFNFLSGEKFSDFISAPPEFDLRRIRFNSGIKYSPDKKDALLHNIYYLYISSSMKQGFKSNYSSKFNLNFFTGDARKNIFKTSGFYDIIFLDAYTPKKAPSLWTIDFLEAVKSKMNYNSLLVSYSKAAPFRGALSELGFCTGKIFCSGIEAGTIASLSQNLIKTPLDEYSLELLKTRSGIPFRDKNLSLQSDEIFLNRAIEAAASNRISRSQFDKLHS